MFNRIIVCNNNDVDYLSVRVAMAQGAKTIEDVVNIAGICNKCICSEKVKDILSMVCTCKKVSRNQILESIKNGANSLQDVMNITKAGTRCGKCKLIIARLLESEN